MLLLRCHCVVIALSVGFVRSVGYRSASRISDSAISERISRDCRAPVSRFCFMAEYLARSSNDVAKASLSPNSSNTLRACTYVAARNCFSFMLTQSYQLAVRATPQTMTKASRLVLENVLDKTAPRQRVTWLTCTLILSPIVCNVYP